MAKTSLKTVSASSPQSTEIFSPVVWRDPVTGNPVFFGDYLRLHGALDELRRVIAELVRK